MNGTNGIDPVEFGRLSQAVETLVERVEQLSAKVDCISSQMTRGKGVIVGMMIAAGGLGAGTIHAFDKWFK